MIALLSWWLAGAAYAQQNPAPPIHPEENWIALETERARFALTGDLEASTEALAQLTRTVGAEDPSRPEALYQLAWSRWILGDLHGARDALDACLRGPMQRGPCIILRTYIDLESEAVRHTPVHWTFDSPDHGLFHPRAVWDRGTLHLLHDKNGEGVLAWTTAVDPVEIDELVIGFNQPTGSPSTLDLIVGSTDMPARLSIELLDDRGYRYLATTPALRVPQGHAESFRVDLTRAHPVAAGGAPFEPAHLFRIHIIDLTGDDGSIGTNTIEIHDLSIQ